MRHSGCSTVAPIGFTWTSWHFVPNLTIGASVIKSLAYLDCHLMVTNPFDYVEPLGDAENWQQIIQEIKSKGRRPGVALRPGTPIREVYPLVESENPRGNGPCYDCGAWFWWAKVYAGDDGEGRKSQKEISYTEHRGGWMVG
ncbi:hypothetical protein MLD38_000303 [Melastoma candidum]|uniref:Uncharacterized protein n=1 Tax=Melastoma candidum TaxID=119954 RepID=A0ACB9SAY3_9MYRT|nr:hypothetical protein MLD38_000303 [Melastoma candidum]